MDIKETGYRWKDLHLWEQLKHTPYDYERNGLLNKLLPSVIMNTTNDVTKYILSSTEYVLVWLMKYVDVLKNFKNYNYKINW